MNIIPVVLLGGCGSRLWPVSRMAHPKQLLSLWGDKSLLQQTLERARAVTGDGPMILVSGHEYRFQVAEQARLAGIVNARILLEPVGRNTAPAIALAALDALSSQDNPVLLVLPSDHLIRDAGAFTKAVDAALPFAEKGALMTFGVLPDKAATGYGYIKAEQAGISRVASFVEKPDAETASRYLASGDYYWNSGMFLFRAQAYLDELQRHAPEMHRACVETHRNIQQDLDFLRIPPDLFADCPSDSIDYAVMENTDKAMVVPLQAGWSELGSWESLWEIGDKDDNGNVAVGDVFLNDARNCYIRSESRLVSVAGLDDCIVIETADAVLVTTRQRAEAVKAIVQALREQCRDEASNHRKLYRPWGSYEVINEGDRFKVKRITVKPGGRLSMQMHHHRAEHWVVVRGTAKVTCNEREFFVSENESTYIPLGVKHRLENPGSIDLDLVEVQSGSYLGEDDIVRFDDSYGRCS